MDQLNQRQIELLKLLISDNSYEPIKTFAHTLGVSNKTISSDLDEIQPLVEKTGATLERKSGSGVKLLYDESQLFQLLETINSYRNTHEQISVEQRRAEIARTLLLNSKKYTTIQKLSDKYYVSRTSILKDLEIIEDKFKEFNIKIIRSREGTRISAREMDIRNALVDVLQENIMYNSHYLIEYQLLRHSEKNIEGFDEIAEISFFEELLNTLEKDMKRIIYEPYYTNLLTHLFIMTKRIKEGNNLEEISGDYSITSIDKQIYQSTLKIVDKIEEQYHICISDNEIFYIYQYLISSGLRNLKEQPLKPNDQLEALSKAFTKNIIEVIADISEIDFNYNPKLFQSLLLHIKPMLNRLNAGIKIRNPLLEEISTEFSQLFHVTEIACRIVCKNLRLKNISLDEVAYMMTYFQSEIEKINTNKKTLVICHSGYGTSQILATRLRKSFANLEIVDVISSSKLNRASLEGIDLIISTVQLNIDKPYILVSSFLSEADSKNIQNLIDNQSAKKAEKSSREAFGNICIEESYEYQDEKELQNIFKKSKDTPLNKRERIYLNENTSLYLLPSKKDRISIYRDIIGKKRELYLIEYENYDYLISTLKKIIQFTL